MQHTFYSAVAGDPLNSGTGSHVLARKGGHITIEGPDGRLRNMAFIGDEAYCSVCDSIGMIVAGAGVSEKRRAIDQRGHYRRQAVGGDMVACACAEKPRIVAKYGRRWAIYDNKTESSASTNRSAMSAEVCDEQIHASGEGATTGYPYFIDMPDGRTQAGRLAHGAWLSRVSTQDEGEYVVYWGDEALAKQAGD